MTVCWRTRECPPDMQEACRHAVTDYDMCPTKCNFGECYREQRELTSDPALIFNPDVDRSQALKQSCLYCAYFLTNGPHKKEGDGEDQNG